MSARSASDEETERNLNKLIEEQQPIINYLHQQIMELEKIRAVRNGITKNVTTQTSHNIAHKTFGTQTEHKPVYTKEVGIYTELQRDIKYLMDNDKLEG